jgi:hypothetical protein
MSRFSRYCASLLAVLMLSLASQASAQIVQWQQLVHGRISGNAIPPDRRGIAIDSSGNVLMVASVYSHASYPDLRTAKYSGSNGGVIWDRTFNAGDYTKDEARGIALDLSDNVIVGAGGAQGSRVIKYANDSTERWNVSLQSQMDDLGFIALDGSGNVYAVGLRVNGGANNIRILKLAASNGAILWDRSYGATGVAITAAGATVDPFGAVLIIGAQASGGGDIVTLKYSTSGNLVWENTYAGAAGGKDSPSQIAVDGSGNALVAGYTTNAVGNADFITLKYASNGTLTWSQTFEALPGAKDIADSIAVDAAGDVYVAGSSENLSQSPTVSTLQVIKYAAGDGAQLWRQEAHTITGGTLAATGLAVDPAGSLLVAATHFKSDTSATSLAFKHAASTGALAWSKSTDGDVANSIAVDGSGGVIVCGYGETPGGAYDIKMTKYSSAGVDQWRALAVDVPQPRYSAITHVVVDNAGNLAATGFTYSRPGLIFENEDFKTVKFDGATGTVLWERTFAGSSAYPDNPVGIATDSGGNVVVAGIVHDGQSPGYIKVLKYRASDGEVMWQASYVGSAAYGTRPIGLQMDASGNVVISGWGYNGSVYELRTIKIAGATGALSWQRLEAYAGNTYANGMTLDSAGNAIITGNTTDAAGATFFKTVKYASSDGTLLWDRTGPSGAGTAVAADSAGNVYVTGALMQANSDYATLKYTIDGTLQWQQSFAGAGQGEDVPIAVKWDGNGGVIVTGHSTLVGGETEFRTLKYRTSDGALLWSSAFGGSGNTSVPHVLAIDASGNVLVAGESGISETVDYRRSDLRAVKYNGATGALMWSLGYDGTAPNSSDAAYAAAASGNVFFVAGVSEESGLPGGMRALRVGSVSDTIPDAFGFAPHENAPLSSVRVSSAITPTGYDTATSISVSSGEYSIGCTATFTAAAGTIRPGESVCVRHTSSNQAGGSVTTVLTIGGVSGNFRSTTATTTPPAAKVTGDLNGDGRSDILWYHNESGALYVMQTNGFAPGNSALIDQEGDLNWKVVAVADLNGDGRADVVWQHATTGQVYGLLMDGTAAISEGTIYTEPNTQWKIVGAGDFNADGRADLLWRNAATGDVFVLAMNGLTPIDGDVIYSEPNPQWRIQKIADFNGDEKADILWRNNTTGDVFMMLMNGTVVASGGVIYSEPNTDWQIQGAADFNGDGRADILWRNAVTGSLFMQQMNGTAILAAGAFYTESNAAWKIVATGDYDADGRADILWRNSTGGQVYMMLMDGFAIRQGGMVYTEPDGRWTIVGP